MYIIGHCYNPAGNEDKIYILLSKENVDGKFDVVAWFGRRGNKLMVSIKGTFDDDAQASAYIKKMWAVQRRKGYLEIESFEYEDHVRRTSPSISPLTMNDPAIQAAIDPAGPIGSGPTPKPVKKPTPRKVPPVKIDPDPKSDPDDLVLICVDNSGIEDRFDLHVEYVIENHSSEGMIWAYDNFGKKGEYLEGRFAAQDTAKIG